MKSKKPNIELEKLKEMSWSDRLWYIWEYYKVPILAALGAVFLLVSLVPSIINNRDPIFSCYVVNAPIYGQSYDDLTSGFRDFAGIPTDERWDFDSSMVIDWENSSTGYEYMMKITAVIASKGLDVMLGDETTMLHFSKLAGYSDLEEVLPERLLKQWSDRLYFIEDEEGDTHGYALDVSDSPILKTAGITNPVYYSILANTPHIDISILFLEYLMQ